MCGIAGFISLLGPRAPQWMTQLGHAMTTALAHRGEGAEEPHVSADGMVMLSCVRLAVRDRSAAGNQPMTSPDGRTTLVHNGEVYGSRSPARATWPRRTLCDTEFVLQQVSDGAEPDTALRALDGMFALAWHDASTGRTVLARDHFGIKPLYYTFVQGGILFASEPTALISTGLVTPEVDPEEYVLRSWIRMDAADEHTWLKGVQVLQPAEYLVVDAPHVRTRRYWQPDPGDRPTTAEEIRTVFDRAVSMRTPADVPRAALLSGGIDSTALFSALRGGGEEVHPYVLRYEDGIGGSADDVHYARVAADHAGAPLTVCELSRRSMIELLPELPRRLMRPVLHGSELAMHQLYGRVAEDGHVVVYSGHGADEMWGYQDSRYFPIVDPSAPGHLHGRDYLTRHLYSAERPVWGRMMEWMARELDVDMADIHEQIWDRTLREYRALTTLDPIKRGRFHLMRRFLVYVNDMTDMVSSSFTLEDRPVFQDVALAELAFRTAEYTKSSAEPGSYKDLLKSALTGLLPAPVVQRPKQGFPAPTAPGYRQDLETLAADSGMPFGLPRPPKDLWVELGVGELMFLGSSTAWLDAIRTEQPGTSKRQALTTMHA